MKPHILVIDNYDSFVYNLVHYLEDLGAKVTVKRNDQFAIEAVKPFDKILLSPGPGIPSEAGLLKPLVEAYAASKHILGVCLGLQAIGEVFGGTLTNLEEVYHGIATPVTQTVADEALFAGFDNTFAAGRYHSWVIDKNNFPDSLEITSLDGNDQIMSLRHRAWNVKGVQFHPESVLTPNGKQLLRNWLKE